MEPGWSQLASCLLLSGPSSSGPPTQLHGSREQGLATVSPGSTVPVSVLRSRCEGPRRFLHGVYSQGPLSWGAGGRDLGWLLVSLTIGNPLGLFQTHPLSSCGWGSAPGRVCGGGWEAEIRMRSDRAPPGLPGGLAWGSPTQRKPVFSSSH